MEEHWNTCEFYLFNSFTYLIYEVFLFNRKTLMLHIPFNFTVPLK